METYIKELMHNLSMELLDASKAYYNGLPDVMSDASYDDKINLLLSLEKRYPQYKLGADGSGAKSPTELVGANVASSLETVKHEKKLLSLDKRYSVDEILTFLDGNYPAVGSLKGDGLTIEISMKQRLLADAVTRGNGEIGERVLNNVRRTNVPAAIPFDGELIIRCEAMISKDSFQMLKEKYDSEGKTIKTARNLVSGTIRSLDPKITEERQVELHSFELITANGITAYRIFQAPVEHDLCFRCYEDWQRQNRKPRVEDYRQVYQDIASLEKGFIKDDVKIHSFLEELYMKMQGTKPYDYIGRSLSVSDVIVIDYVNGDRSKSKAFFCDDKGFKEITFDCETLTFPFASDFKARKFLEQMGFECIDYKLLNNPEEVIKYIDVITEMRENNSAEIPFDIDGIVFMIDAISKRKKLGVTAKYPNFALALKFPNKGQVTGASEMNWQAGMYSFTPVVTLDPPLYFGVTVSKATAHNLAFVLGKNDKGEVVRPPIRTDGSCEIKVERGGEVIPKIVEVFYNAEQAIEFDSLDELYPKFCPVCNAPTYIEGVDLKCSNDVCPGKLKAKLRNMTSRNNLNMEGFGESTINMLVDNGFIKAMTDIFTLQEHRDSILKMDGYGEKKFDKLIKEVKATNKVPLNRVIASLCIPNVGAETARCIVPILPNGLIDLLTVSEDQLKALDGIGEVTAKNIVKFALNNKNLIICYLYHGLGLILKDPSTEQVGSSLTGKTFVVTGTLFESRTAVENIIRKNGGSVSGSVSGKTTYLVVGTEPGASKVSEAKKHNVEMITGEDLLSLIQ